MHKTIYILGWVVMMSTCLHHLSHDNWILNKKHPTPSPVRTVISL